MKTLYTPIEENLAHVYSVVTFMKAELADGVWHHKEGAEEFSKFLDFEARNGCLIIKVKEEASIDSTPNIYLDKTMELILRNVAAMLDSCYNSNPELFKGYTKQEIYKMIDQMYHPFGS